MKYRWLSLIVILSVLAYFLFLFKGEPSAEKLYQLESFSEDYDVNAIYRLQNTKSIVPVVQGYLEDEAKNECQNSNERQYKVWIFTDKAGFEVVTNCSNFITTINESDPIQSIGLEIDKLNQKFDIEIIQSINDYYSFNKWLEIDLTFE